MRSHAPRKLPAGRLSRARRAAAALSAAATLAVTAAGLRVHAERRPSPALCRLPDGDGQAQPYPAIVPVPPLPNASPGDIVRGFLAASASFVGQQYVAGNT